MNIKFTRTIALLVALLLLTGATLHFAAAQESSTTLSIAFIGAGNGSQAAQERALYQAAVLAAEQINDDELTDADGSTYHLEVTYYEADSTTEVADALNDALDDGAIAILGPDDTTRLDALVDAGTPDLAVLSASSDAPQSENVFRLSASADDWAQAAADFLINERHYTQIATVAADTETAQTGIETFTANVDEDNIVAALTHEADEDDFTTDAQTIRESGADAVFAWTLDAQARMLLTELRAIGWNGLFLYQGLDNQFIERAGAELVTGTMGTVNWTAAAYDTASQEFVSDYHARWDAAPLDHAAAYYDAVHLIAAAVATVGDNPAAIADNIAANDSFDGAQGNYINGESTSLRMMQAAADGTLMDVARYTAGACLNCVDTVRASVDTTVEQRAIFNIAFVGTLDGAAETVGLAAQQGAELALREINDAGGVIAPDGTRYILSLNSTNVTSAESIANVFAQSGASIVLGPDFNSFVLPNLRLPASSGIPQLVSATSSQVAENDVADYVFQMRANDATLARAAAEYLLNEREFTTFATISARTDYGLDTVNVIEDTIAAADEGQVVLSLEHDVDETDFTGYARQIADSGAQAVFAWTTQPAAAQLLTALDAAGWQGVFVYGYLTPEYAQTLNMPAGIEVIAPVSWWNTANDWASVDFSARYTERFGESPTPQSAVYYDAMYLLASGIEAVGAESAALQTWLLDQQGYRGVQGVYDPAVYGDGEMSRSVMLLRVDSTGIHESARYENDVCWVNCGS
ncbi:MAG: ABC transporter substrate-binding protein [Anaerolineae bacterium]